MSQILEEYVCYECGSVLEPWLNDKLVCTTCWKYWYVGEASLEKRVKKVVSPLLFANKSIYVNLPALQTTE